MTNVSFLKLKYNYNMTVLYLYLYDEYRRTLIAITAQIFFLASFDPDLNPNFISTVLIPTATCPRSDIPLKLSRR